MSVVINNLNNLFYVNNQQVRMKSANYLKFNCIVNVCG